MCDIKSSSRLALACTVMCSYARVPWLLERGWSSLSIVIDDLMIDCSPVTLYKNISYQRINGHISSVGNESRLRVSVSRQYRSTTSRCVLTTLLGLPFDM